VGDVGRLSVLERCIINMPVQQHAHAVGLGLGGVSEGVGFLSVIRLCKLQSLA